MSDMNDFNQQVIAEFRANGGKVGGYFEGQTMAVITHTGAKSGVERTTPLVATRDGGDVIIIASMGGAPTHPAWFRNLVANPDVQVEVGDDTYAARAVVVTDEAERRRLYDAQAAVMASFKEYEQKTTRVIPVVRLVRV